MQCPRHHPSRIFGLLVDRNLQNGAMTSASASAYATCFMSPKQEWIPVMFVSVGKLEMASIMLDVGLIPSFVTLNPSKSTSSLPNLNFMGLNMMLFLAQCNPGYARINLLMLDPTG